MPALRSLMPIVVRLRHAIDNHVDAGDRDEFLDTVMTIATHHDTHKGRGAGDAYLERVIASLTSGSEDDNTED